MQLKKFLKNLVQIIMVGTAIIHGFRTLATLGSSVVAALVVVPLPACSIFTAVGAVLTRTVGPVSLSLPLSPSEA